MAIIIYTALLFDFAQEYDRGKRVQVYRIRSGSVDATGAWQQGSYDELFKANDLPAAQREVDRALENKEIIGVETGRQIRVDGPDGSAHRSIERSHRWSFDQT